RDEIIKLLESRKDMDVNGYVMYCREELGKLTVPRPRAPPVSPKHEDYKTFVDEERVTYMRMKQHEKISLFLTEEEKNTVTTKGKDILDDKRFIQTIASRTGFYIAEEVRDCLSEFFNFRDSSRRLLTYYA
nr:Chain Ub, mL105 [Polytomella magna]